MIRVFVLDRHFRHYIIDTYVANYMLVLSSCVDDNTLRWQMLVQICSRGCPRSAIYIQRLDDPLNSAIHTSILIFQYVINFGESATICQCPIFKLSNILLHMI